MSNETNTTTGSLPTVPTHYTYKGISYPVVQEGTDHYVTVTDAKVGDLRLKLNFFEDGDKAGLAWFSPEYGSVDQLRDAGVDSDAVVDMCNAFMRSKLAAKATALFNAKAGAKADDVSRQAFLKQLEEAKNLIISTEDAVDYRPFERGASISGLMKKQKDILSKINDCSRTNPTAVPSLFAQFQEIVQKIMDLQRKEVEAARQIAEYVSGGGSAE